LPNLTKPVEQSLLENVAAISAEFHSDKRYAKFYSTFCETLCGFPGIWALMVIAAEVFTKECPEDPDAYEWIDAILYYTGGILNLVNYRCENPQSVDILQPLALSAIKTATFLPWPSEEQHIENHNQNNPAIEATA
jgi:hypothetical protein